MSSIGVAWRDSFNSGDDKRARSCISNSRVCLSVTRKISSERVGLYNLLMSDAGWEVVVLGAGAAGLMAAIAAAEAGRRTLLLEKNRRAGVKILMSGGTR